MKKKTKRRAMLLVGLTVVPSIVLADDLLFGRRLRNRCCLPGDDYSTDRFSSPISGNSLRAIRSTAVHPPTPATGSTALVSTATASREVSLKVFQIEPARLRIDHCEVSQIAVTVADSGEWHVSFQARQDPRLLEPAQRTEFERFRRNELRLEIRPILVLTARQNAGDAVLGKPELRAIETLQFWVQKEETRRIAERGLSNDLQKYFDQIEQVDVHFSYR